MEALLNRELELFWVLVRADRNAAFPQRAVGGQALETGRDLAEVVDQPVVIILVPVINENTARLFIQCNSALLLKLAWLSRLCHYH